MSNIPLNPPISILDKKQSKNKRIMLWSGIGLTILTVSVSLPFGFLTNFNSLPIAVEPPPRPPLDTPYDPEISLNAYNVDFDAYYVPSWHNKTLIDININLMWDSSIPENLITLENLANIGIVPKNNNWNSWSKVISSPIYKSDTSFLISIFPTIASVSPVSYPVTIDSGALTPSAFYDANIPYVADNNPNYYAYKMKKLDMLTLSDFYLTYTQDSIDPNLLINIQNLEKIGIVPRNDNYKSWVSIKLFPIDGSTIKVIIQQSPSVNDVVSFHVTGFKNSTLYNVNTIINNKNPSFIMYLPNNWKNIYPADAYLNLSSGSFVEDSKRISIATLEKIGIVPLNLDFKNTWSSVQIIPIRSKVCKIIIKSNADADTVASFDLNYFKSNDTLYDTQIILKESSTENYNFIWYRPKAWNNNLLPNNVDLNLIGDNITLSNLENVGIVPLDDGYKKWKSITKTDIKYGLQGKIGISITTNNPQILPIKFEVTGLKQSTTYDSSIILEENADYIRFMPNSFKNPTVDLYEWLRANVNWSGPTITLSNLDILGIVPLNENYKTWYKVIFDGRTTTPPQVHFLINKKDPITPESTISFTYPFDF